VPSIFKNLKSFIFSISREAAAVEKGEVFLLGGN